MGAKIELLEELAAVSCEIEQGEHPYERASEEEQAAYDRELEQLARQREVREGAALQLD